MRCVCCMCAYRAQNEAWQGTGKRIASFRRFCKGTVSDF